MFSEPPQNCFARIIPGWAFQTVFLHLTIRIYPGSQNLGSCCYTSSESHRSSEGNRSSEAVILSEI